MSEQFKDSKEKAEVQDSIGLLLREIFLDMWSRYKKISAVAQLLIVALTVVVVVYRWNPSAFGIFTAAVALFGGQLQSWFFYVFFDWWFPEFVRRMLQALDWKIDIFPLWRDMVTFLGLYTGAHISDVRGARFNKPWRARAFRMVSAALGMIGSIILTSFMNANAYSEFLAMAAGLLLGIVIYTSGFAIQYALDLREFTEEGFFSPLGKKAKGIISFLLLAGLTLGFWFILTASQLVTSHSALEVSLLFLMLAAFGLVHIRWSVLDQQEETAKSNQGGGQETAQGSSREMWLKIRHTGNYNIGVSILIALAVALIILGGGGIADVAYQ